MGSSVGAAMSWINGRWRRVLPVLTGVLLLLSGACQAKPEPGARAKSSEVKAGQSPLPNPLPEGEGTKRGEGKEKGEGTKKGEGPLVVFLGDSLAAGLHLPADQAFPAVVQRELARE